MRDTACFPGRTPGASSLPRFVVFGCLILLLAGCGNNVAPDDAMVTAFDAFNDEIRTVVTDPDRAERAVKLVQQLEVKFDELEDHIAEREAAFVALNADYNATADEFSKLLDKIDQQRRDNKAALVDIYRELYTTLTPDERDQLDKSSSKAVRAGIAALKAI